MEKHAGKEESNNMNKVNSNNMYFPVLSCYKMHKTVSQINYLRDLTIFLFSCNNKNNKLILIF
jgi:hypothetical protein